MVRQATAGLGTIAASVFDLDDIDALKVERDENDQRKKPTISERVALAKAIAERLKPIDPAKIEAARKRYEEVKQAVDYASAKLAAERAQRKNRFIERDKRRFAGASAAAQVGSSDSVAPKVQNATAKPDAGNAVRAPEGRYRSTIDVADLLDERDPMETSIPGLEPVRRSVTRDGMQCEHYADGSSVCVGKDGIALTEALSPYLVQPCTPDSKLEKPTP